MMNSGYKRPKNSRTNDSNTNGHIQQQHWMAFAWFWMCPYFGPPEIVFWSAKSSVHDGKSHTKICSSGWQRDWHQIQASIYGIIANMLKQTNNNWPFHRKNMSAHSQLLLSRNKHFDWNQSALAHISCTNYSYKSKINEKERVHTAK